MTQPDEAIESVFGALRDADAPAGMEARILGNLEGRAAGRAHFRWRKWLLSPAVSIAGIVALASALAVVFFLHPIRRPDALLVRQPESAVPIAGVASNPSVSFNPLAIEAQRSAHPSTEALRPQSTYTVPQAEPLSDEDALAVSEMLAPSKPAPPLPLTHQEQLFAEVVHKDAPEQIADLKPEARERQMEIAKAEFHDFFEPPPPVKDNE